MEEHPYGLKMILIVAGLGLLASGGTYKIADDYGEAVCALRISNAVTTDRIERLETRRRSPN
jgi:hypothetical protein